MNPVLLRRRKLGMTSCREISNQSETGILAVRNDKGIPPTDLVFRWGCTSDVPTKNVVNTAKAIHEVNNKAGFRQKLDEYNLCPSTVFSYAEASLLVEDVGKTLVVRPAVHSRGRKLYVVSSVRELELAIDKCGAGWYASDLIDKDTEYRVFVVQGRAVAVANKIPDNDEAVAWNVAKGGRFENVKWDQWPLKAVRVSIEAFNLSELDFGGVDVMVDKEGNCYVVEINSAPSLTSPYRQQCMTKAFDWIVNHGKERIPLVEEKGGYLKFIHPSVCDRAKLV